jgi:DeoR family fructose operon transcriptional repressor
VFQTERRARILDAVRSDGRVSVNEAAMRFSTTKETIRRDLAELHRAGLIRRVHGGAVAAAPPPFERLLERRGQLNVEAKRRIAAAAAAQLPTSGVVIVDAGSTPQLVAAMLPDSRGLTVVTNSVPTAIVCAAKPSLDVVVVGGDLKSDTMALVGDDAVSGLSRICADVAIVGTDGYSAERGLTCHARDESATKQAMIRTARRAIAVADSSKFGNDYLTVFSDFGDLALLITDTGLPEDDAARIVRAGRGLEVVRA